MTDKVYWLWLAEALGAGARIKEIIDELSSAEKLYNSNILEWRMSSTLTPKQVENLQNTRLDGAIKTLEICEKNGYEIVTFDDERYPKRLKEISNPPAVLYFDGRVIDFDSFAVIGIVGTRKASSYALKAASVMAKGISLCGAVVVSGGALGVDSAAHCGAIEGNMPTFAVLGCGFGTDYLRANEELRNKIKNSGGALISEYPPFTKATRYTFPMRNRIISGLSLGVLVVEAGEKSGSLITANHAKEQRRDIYVIPASIFDYNFLGTNKLIEDGAFVATSPKRLVEQYENDFANLNLKNMPTVRELTENKSREANAQGKEQVTFDNIVKDRAQRVKISETALSLDGDEKTVYNALSEELRGIEDIISLTSLEARRVLTALTMLEMKGLAESASGKRYRLK